MSRESFPQIAIDGPAGAGKSTVAREVASRLKIKYLDTGAMYRAITLKIIRENLDLDQVEALEEILQKTDIKLDENKRVYLDGDDVTDEIRKPHVNDLVSPVSCISSVRRQLVAMQQEIAAEAGGIIMEGRDIASKVMPDADFKIYLDASLEERARRRSREQLEKGIELPEEKVASEIRNRDSIDSGRDDSPLTVVADALVIDTTEMSFEQVVDRVVTIVNEGLR